MVDLGLDKLIEGLSGDLGRLFGDSGESGNPFARAQFGRGADPFAASQFSAPPETFGRAQFSGASPFQSSFGDFGNGGVFEVGAGSAQDPFAGFMSGIAHARNIADEQAKKAAAKKASAAPSGVGATGADPDTDKWREIIDLAAAEYGIDGDAIQAVMMIESGGYDRALSPQGAIGLMQVMPFHWGPGEDPWNPQQNVRKGAKILADNYRRYGNWDKAVAAYLGAIDAQGNITTATDANGTDGHKYAAMFNANMQRIKAARAQRPATTTTTSGNISSIWGGANANVSQEFGHTDYSGAHSDTYAYGATYGAEGHTGLDIGLPRGSRLFAPMAGTVTVAGGTPYFRDEDYGDTGQAGRGELRLQLDDGTVIILGHTSAINVRVGQRVNAGDLLGLSGSANGDHLHLEVRVVDRSLPSGYRIIDPRAYFVPRR